MRQRVDLHVAAALRDVLGAGQRVGAVDVEGAGAADALAAGAPEGQRRVDLVLDLDEGVQDHRPAGLEIDLEAVEPRVLAGVRVVAVDLEGLDLLRAGRRLPGLARLDLAVAGKGELGHRFSSGASVHPRLGREGLDLVGHGGERHRARGEGGLALLVHPAERVLHPVLVVAIREVLAGVRAAALGAVRRRGHGGDRLVHEVVELQRLDQVGVPDHRAVGDRDVRQAAPDLRQAGDALVQRLAGAEDRGVALHHALHLGAQLRGRRAALGMAQAVEPPHGQGVGLRGERPVRRVRLHQLGRAQRRDAFPHGVLQRLADRLRGHFRIRQVVSGFLERGHADTGDENGF